MMNHLGSMFPSDTVAVFCFVFFFTHSHPLLAPPRSFIWKFDSLYFVHWTCFLPKSTDWLCPDLGTAGGSTWVCIFPLNRPECVLERRLCVCALWTLLQGMCSRFYQAVFIKLFFQYNKNYCNKLTHTHSVCFYSCKGLLLHIHTHAHTLVVKEQPLLPVGKTSPAVLCVWTWSWVCFPPSEFLTSIHTDVITV